MHKILRNKKAILILSIIIALAFAGTALALHPATSPFNNHKPNQKPNNPNPKTEKGILYVYLYSNYTGEAPEDGIYKYSVLPGQPIYIQIADITEFEEDDLIQVRIGWEGYEEIFENIPVHNLTSGAGSGKVGVGDADNPIQWIVGEFEGEQIDIPYCETLVVRYRNNTGTGRTYVARGEIRPVRHLHIIPENYLGTLGVTIAAVAGLGAFTLIEKRINKGASIGIGI